MSPTTIRPCWCGNAELVPFGGGYSLCRDCGTLVSQRELPVNQFEVSADEAGFYGKQYWLTHQRNDLGFPDIHDRARTDLAERNLHWLKTLLENRLPPAQVVELGCAHGSFVALLKQAGYDASGVELSPWVVEFGRRTFNVPIALGPIETLAIPNASLDAVVLMDVIEHLPDPVATIAHCLTLLKSPEGMLLVQTPRFREETDYGALVEENSPFLDMLIADEHIYLFSDRSIGRFFQSLGVETIQFKHPLFDRYDMFLAASFAPLPSYTQEQKSSALLASPGGRMVLGLLDVHERELALVRERNALAADQARRGQQIESLTRMVNDSERDRTTRVAHIESLTKMLNESEADRTARAAQIDSLTKTLNESEADRTARAAHIESLTKMLNESEADRTARGAQIESLTQMLNGSEADRAARGAQIESLTQMLNESEADRTARGTQIQSLTQMLNESEADRAARGTQIELLTQMLTEVKADRKAHTAEIESRTNMPDSWKGEWKVAAAANIDSPTEMLNETEADRPAPGTEIASLRELLNTSQAECAALSAQIRSLTRMLNVSEVDRDSRARQIESLSSMLTQSHEASAVSADRIESMMEALRRSEAERLVRAQQVESLGKALHESETDRSARAAQIEALGAALNQYKAECAARDRQLELVAADLRALFGRPLFRLSTMFSRWPELKALAQRIDASRE